MGSLRSKKGKGSYASYRSSNRLGRNKEAREAKQKRRLEKRKSWRIQKYSGTPQVQLSSTTLKLFDKWNVPLHGPKKVKSTKPESKVFKMFQKGVK